MLVLVAWIAIGAAGFYIFTSHKQLLAAANAVRTVDTRAREADEALAEVRIAQQSYVAAGQGVAFWMPKVEERRTAFDAALTAMRGSSTSGTALASIDEAAAAMREFEAVDKRARDYVRAGQSLMASDVIFSEAGQLAAVAARQVETARLAERQALDAIEAESRRTQAMAAGGAAGLAALIALVLGVTGQGRERDELRGFSLREPLAGPAKRSAKPAVSLSLNVASPDVDEGIVSHARPAGPQPQRKSTAVAPAPAPANQAAARNAAMLRAAADLATDFGRVRDSAELERLLGRAADLLDAGGLVVWLAHGDHELRPALTHGYTPQVLARMPSIPRTADNAAAAAFRSGALQIVLSKPGGPAGAIVAPILAPDGCIGALSAEIKGGGEGSEAVQAVAAIVAAHLASVIGTPAAAEPEAAGQEQRAAQA